MEKKNMKLFGKKDKYNIEPEDNIPQEVYGIPNSMMENKYNIEPEDNIPQKVYWLWKRCAQVYFIAILIHALCYFFMNSVPWGVWWLVTISFAIYLSFQIGYGIKRIVEMKFMD